MEYMVTKNLKQIGTVYVEQVGLYLNIQCQCCGLESGFHRLHVVFEDKTVDLGVLILDGRFYMTNRRIPVKAFGRGEPKFFVTTDSETARLETVHLQFGQPVKNVEMIRTGKLLDQNGEFFLFFSL